MKLPAAHLPERARGSEWLRLVLAALLGLGLWVTTVSTAPANPSDTAIGLAAWALLVDPILGTLGLVLAHWRHRWPVRVALATALLTVGSWTALGASTLTSASIGARRRLKDMALVGAVAIACGVLTESVYDISPGSDPHPIGLLMVSAAFVLTTLAIGYAVGSRREVIASLRDRAETAEREQATRVAAAQLAERSRIAREMHDVLAHRISLIAMHASALSFRPDLPPTEQREAIATIEENSRKALVDLRDVLGVLRDPAGPTAGADGVTAEAPQPTHVDLPALVAEARAAGTTIDYSDETTGQPSPTTGRTAYRVVQEGLTNARKHAPGARVRVTLSGDEATGLRVDVRTPRPVAAVTAAALPGAGLGLVGLRERTELAGGRLRHDLDDAGDFVLSAWLPWW